jgi:cell cycle sensor histidine kinase DivJ
MSRVQFFSSEAHGGLNAGPARDAAVSARLKGRNIETVTENFIRLRLALTLPVMALAPIFLLARGAPSLWDALTFALLLAPLAGVHVLRRYGCLDVAQAICVVAMLSLGAALTCAQGALSIGAVCCFLLALLEAASGAASGVARGVAAAGAALTLAVVAILLAATVLGFLRPAADAGDPLDGAMLATAAIYGALLAVWSARMAGLRDRAARASADAYRDLMEVVGDMVLRFDAAGRVVQVESEPAASFGCSPESLLGRGLFERVLVGDRPAFLKCVADAAWSEGASSRVAFRLRMGPELRGGEAVAPPFVRAELRARKARAGAGAVLASLREVVGEAAFVETLPRVGVADLPKVPPQVQVKQSA